MKNVLYSVCTPLKGVTEYEPRTSVTYGRYPSLPETLNFVFTMFAEFPKLDVAGSNPVSRSNLFNESTIFPRLGHNNLS